MSEPLKGPYRVVCVEMNCDVCYKDCEPFFFHNFNQSAYFGMKTCDTQKCMNYVKKLKKDYLKNSEPFSMNIFKHNSDVIKFYHERTKNILTGKIIHQYRHKFIIKNDKIYVVINFEHNNYIYEKTLELDNILKQTFKEKPEIDMELLNKIKDDEIKKEYHQILMFYLT